MILWEPEKKRTFSILVLIMYCNNSLDFRILNINYDSFIHLLFSKIWTQQSYADNSSWNKVYVCMYVGRYVCMLHRLSRTLRRVKQRTERDDKKQA